MLRILEDASSLGVMNIEMSGGEPLVWPYLFSTIRRISELNMSSLVSTSGFGLTDSIARDFAKAGLTYCWVSINGSNQQIHNLSRDCYQEGVYAVQKLVAAGISCRINWVARHDNAKDFPELVLMAKSLGVRGVSVLAGKINPFGELESPLDRNDMLFLSDVIRDIIKKENKGFVDVENCFSHLKTLIYGKKYTPLRKGCSAGRFHMAFDVDGNCLPCRHLPYPEKYTSISDFWHNSKTVKALRNMENSMGYPCNDCVHMDTCLICRAVCKETNTDFNAGYKDYLLSKNSTSKMGIFTQFTLGGCNFGIDCYELLKTYIGNIRKINQSYIDFMPFHIIWEHKKYMTELCKYLYQNNILDDDNIIHEYTKVEKVCCTLRNKAIKYNITHQFYILNDFESVISYIANTESAIIKQILSSMAKCIKVSTLDGNA